MGRQKAGKMLLATMCVLLIGWPLYQIYDLYHTNNEKRDAVQLLYEVSTFQMELLGNFLMESAAAGQTADLNALKQSAYSANFTHQRLKQALGEDSVGDMESLQELLQFIISTQIVGNRTLKPSETETLRIASEEYAALFEAYRTLVSKDGDISESQKQVLKETDEKLAKLFKQKALE